MSTKATLSFFAERSQTDQHGHAAPIFPKVLLLEWLDCPDHLQLCISPRVALAPFRRRQVRPTHAIRDEILTVVADDAEKCVVGLDDPAVEIPGKDADDVGVDQPPNSRFAFREIAVRVRKRQRALLLGFEQAHVFDGDHRLVGEGLEKRDLFVGERPDSGGQ